MATSDSEAILQQALTRTKKLEADLQVDLNELAKPSRKIDPANLQAGQAAAGRVAAALEALVKSLEAPSDSSQAPKDSDNHDH